LRTGVHSVAYGDLLCYGDYFSRNFLIDAFVDKYSVLPCKIARIGGESHDGILNSLVDIGIGKNNNGLFPPSSTVAFFIVSALALRILCRLPWSL